MNFHLNYCVLLMILSLASIQAMAQVVFSDEKDRFSQGSLHICIAGENDKCPVPYASLFLKTANDTIIRYFTISDQDGIATLEKVDYEKYLMHIESMGYTSHTSPILVDRAITTLDTVFLAENARWLEEAIEICRRVGAEKSYLTHLSHMLPRHADLTEELSTLPFHLQPAYDGLRVDY